MRALRFPPPGDPSAGRSADAATPTDADAFLDDLDRLAADATDADAFYGRLLESTTPAIGALVAERWRAAPDAAISRAERFHAAGVGLATLPAADARRLAAVRDEGLPKLWPAERRGLVGAWLACPVRGVDGTRCLLAFALPEGVSEAVAARTLEFVTAVGEVAERFEIARRTVELADTARRLSSCEAFALRVHALRGVRPVARAIVDAARDAVGGGRAALLVRPGRGRWRVIAVSGAPRHAARSDAVRRMERLARAVAIGDAGVVSGGATPHAIGPLGADPEPGVAEALAPQIVNAVDHYADAAGATALIAAPCQEVDVDGEPRGPGQRVALLVERFEGAFPDDAPDRLAPIARHATVAMRRASAGGRLAALVRPSRLLLAAALTASLVASAAALWLIRVDLTVTADGRFVPAERARVFAPVDGVVQELMVDHGAAVAEGQPLVRLRSPQLEIEQEKVAEALAITRQEIASLETAKLRGRLGPASDDFDAAAVSARVAALRQQLTHQRRRRDLLAEEAERLVVTSPVAGEVVSWRPADYLADRPVTRGDRLLEVASREGDWRIEIDLPDHQTGPLLAVDRDALRVRYVVKAAPDAEHAGDVVRVATATRVDAEGRPVLRVEVRPDAASRVSPRSGLAVVAKIDCGKHRLGYAWCHEAWKAFLRRWF